MPFVRDKLHSVETFRDNLSETQWDLIRVGAVIAVLGAVGAAGFLLGRPVWRHWQNRRALAQARAFEHDHDYRNMLLALERAAEMAPQDFGTWQEIAGDLMKIGSADTLIAQEQMTRLAPKNFALRQALVEDALRFGRYDQAHDALAGFDDESRRNAAFHRLAVALALAEGRLPEVREQLAQLIAIDRHNLNARFAYAALRLWESDPATVEAARAELDGMLSDPAVRIRATIELLSEAAQKKDMRRVQWLLAQFLRLYAPRASPDFNRNDHRAWNAILTGMKTAAAQNPTDTALMARWLAGLGQRRDVVSWLETLPPAVGNAPVVAETAALLSAEEGDDPVLTQRLRAGAWGHWPEKAQDLALSAHHLTGTAAAPAVPAIWDQAIAACGDSLDGLRNLGRLATAWQHPQWGEAAWLAILQRDPNISWAYEALRASYTNRGNFADLMKLYERWLAHSPNDSLVAASWITLGCILGQVTPEMSERVADLPADSAAATVARAAVLWRRERPEESLKGLKTLSSAQLSDPDVAYWLALVDADLGDAGATRSALADAMRFPRQGEALALLQRAAARVGVPLPAGAGT